MPDAYKVLDDLVLPSLGDHPPSSSSTSTILASLPLHTILPRRQRDRAFAHHTTPQGKAYNKTAKKKPKSRWYLEDLKQRREKTQERLKTHPSRTQGNKWIRQSSTSRASAVSAEIPKTLKRSGENRRSSSGRNLPLPTAEEKEEQRKLERMPWRYQSGRARRRSLLNPHKRILGLWDPTADVHSIHMEALQKSGVMKDYESRARSRSPEKSASTRVVNSKARSWLASRSRQQDARVEIGPVITTQSKMEEEEEAFGVQGGLTITDFVTPLTKHKNQLELREATQFLEAKLGNATKSPSERARSDSSDLLKEIEAIERQRVEKIRENMKKLKATSTDDADDGGDDGGDAAGDDDFDEGYGSDDDYDDDQEATPAPAAELETNDPASPAPAPAPAPEQEESESTPEASNGSGNDGDDQGGDDDYDDYGDDDDDYDDDYSDDE